MSAMIWIGTSMSPQIYHGIFSDTELSHLIDSVRAEVS